MKNVNIVYVLQPGLLKCEENITYENLNSDLVDKRKHSVGMTLAVEL